MRKELCSEFLINNNSNLFPEEIFPQLTTKMSLVNTNEYNNHQQQVVRQNLWPQCHNNFTYVVSAWVSSFIFRMISSFSDITSEIFENNNNSWIITTIIRYIIPYITLVKIWLTRWRQQKHFWSSSGFTVVKNINEKSRDFHR